MTASDRLPKAAFDLARRFAAGATLWCASPEWPWHARHVAVEFVHPVVVGKRALPAVALAEAGVADQLRTVSRPGDIFLALATARSEDVTAALRRCSVWGLTGLWVGAGPPPGDGAPDHVLWFDVDPCQAAFDGTFVRAYHLLWELTHVCFEHPGLLTPRTEPTCEADGHCVTCSDEGRLAEIVAVGTDTVTVRSAMGIETVDAMLIAAPREGDVVLVHAGTAISKAGS